MVFGMGGGDEEIAIRVTSDGFDELDSKAEESQSRLAGFGEVAQTAGKALMGMATVSVTAIGTMVNEAMNVETAYGDVNTMLSKGQDAASIFGSTVEDLTTRYAAHGGQVEVIQGLYQTLSAGITDTADAAYVMEQAMKVARAGGAETAIAVDALTTIINGYGMQAEEAARISDILFRTVQTGKTTFPELASAIGNIIPISSSMGVAIEDVAAGVATLTKQGQTTSESVNNMRQALVTLQKPTTTMEKAMKQLGYQSGQAMLESLGFAGTLRELASWAAETGTPMAELWGSVEALNAAMPIGSSAADVYTQDLATMKDAAGAADTAFNAVADTNEFRLTQAFNRVRVMAGGLGESFLTVLLPAITFLLDGIEDLYNWFNTLPEPARNSIARFTVLTTVLMGLAGAALYAAPLITGVGAALYSVALPITAVVAAIVLLSAAWETNFLGIQDITSSTLSSVSSELQSFASWATTTWDTFTGHLTHRWDLIDRILISSVTDALDAIQAVVDSGLALLKAIWTGDTAAIQQHWEAFLDNLKLAAFEGVQALRDVLVYGLTGIAYAIVETFDFVPDEVAYAITDTVNVVASGLMAITADLLGFEEESKDSWGTTMAAWENLTKLYLPRVRQLVNREVTQMSNAAKQTLSAAVQRIGIIWGGLRPLLPKPVRNAADAIIRIGGEIVTGFRTTSTKISNAWNTHVQPLGGRAQTTFSNVKNAATTHYGAAKRTIQGANLAVRNSWNTNVQPLITRANQVFGQVHAFAMQYWPQIQRIMQLAAKVGRKAWDTFIAPLVGAAQRTFGGVANWATQHWGKTRSEVDKSSRQMKQSWNQQVAPIQAASNRVFGKISQTVTSKTKVAKQAWTAGMQGMKAGWNRHIEPLRPWATALFNAILATIRTTTRVGKQVWNTALNGMWGTARMIGDGIKGTFEWWLDSIELLLNLALAAMDKDWVRFNNLIDSYARKTFNGLLNFIKRWGGEFKGFINGRVVTPVVSSFRSMTGRLVSAVRSKIGGVRNAFNTSKNRVLSTVSSMKTQSVSRVRSMLSSITGAATGWVDNFVRPFENARDRIVKQFEKLENKVIGNSIVPEMMDGTLAYAADWRDPFVGVFDSAREGAVSKMDDLLGSVGGLSTDLLDTSSMRRLSGTARGTTGGSSGPKNRIGLYIESLTVEASTRREARSAADELVKQLRRQGFTTGY